jgi:hypothetical protein
MNNPINNIFQYIVPLTFLAIWALTWLLNREAQPLPPRANRPPGPRPGMPPRPLERRPEPVPRDPALRWQPTGSADRAGVRRPPTRPDSDIIILESEPRRTPAPAPPRPAPGVVTRRNTRSKAAPQSSKRPETETPRALSASLAKEADPQLGRPLELTPLKQLQTSLATAQAHDVGKTPSDPSRPARSGASPIDIASLVRSPAKLREAVIMSEVLGPPIALRGRRRR